VERNPPRLIGSREGCDVPASLDSNMRGVVMAKSLARPQVTGQGDVYWEDLETDAVISGPGVTITDSHLVSWAGLTGDWVSLHLDAQYAATQKFGQRIAHGPLTMSLTLGLLTQTGIFGNVVAWLGIDQVRAVKPVIIGDTIHPEARLVNSRLTSEPGVGIWTFDYNAVNQKQVVVMTFRGSFLVSARAEAELSAAGGGPSASQNGRRD
jgi:acyl dehydratase